MVRICGFILLWLLSDCWGLNNHSEKVNKDGVAMMERMQNNGSARIPNLDRYEKPYTKHVNNLKKYSLNSNIEENLQYIVNQIPNEKCKTDMNQVLKGLKNKEKWALKLFDAFPKFPLGLLYGNMYQLGNFDECISVQNVEITGQYCLADIAFQVKDNYTGLVRPLDDESEQRGKFNSTSIHWAICLPSTCNPKDGEILVEEVFSSLIDLKSLEVIIEEKSCYYKQPNTTSIGEIVYGSTIALLLVFILLATVLHLWTIKKRKKYVSYNVDAVREHNVSLTSEVILSFSLIQTVSKFLQIKPTDLNLECISGIKVLSMMFIIAGHSLIFLFGSPVSNAEFAFEMYKQVNNSIFLNSALLVDTFLVVSGFLMCRLLLLELDKRKGKINFLVLYIARYIRLTPAYLVILGYYLTWLPNVGDGPLWKNVTETENSRCKNSWWANLLYVNNYVQTDQLCMFQAWYLAADYHLFIVAPFLIYPLWKWPKPGVSLLVTVTIGTIILPGYITYKNELDPTILAFSPEIQDLSTNYYFVTAYIKTHMRASSYFLGMIFGYLVHEMQTNCYKLSAVNIWIGWILATIFSSCSMFSIVFFLDPDYSYDAVISSIYAPLHRVAWALALGWVIVACVTDNAAIINKFLSWKIFIPLSRLTYCAYLVNGLVLIWHKGSARDAVSWTRLGLAYVLFGHLVMTCILAFVLCICFESPIHGIEKILLRKGSRSSSSSNQSSVPT
ncbi:unnamed protein product [Ceutorhynchus assimilis]|uniref:Nose resistant-to-fluoxetine protein N-terminal domain-containing protein n=1 Tax=Ceutorhynchus assimilis TaxID=467358 RepID=A0A9N9MHS7_9CUCU|nr:unnamed protein product [Ceutorhynchus assimilis]